MQVRVVRAFLAAMLIGGLYAAPAPAATKNFVAVLNGGQETPSTPSGAFGVAFLTFDDKTNSLCYFISFTRLEGGLETAAHLHGPAVPGKPADVVVALVAGNPKNMCVTVPASLPNGFKAKRDIKRGMTYLNIHSHDFPGGEIRGQVIPVK